MVTQKQLQKLLPRFTIENHPFDLGYWTRIAGLPKPRNAERREGWEQADEELKWVEQGRSSSQPAVSQQEPSS